MDEVKRFNWQYGAKRGKYYVYFHDGVSKHDDGSDFFDLRIFTNAVLMERFVQSLRSKGYIEE